MSLVHTLIQMNGCSYLVPVSVQVLVRRLPQTRVSTYLCASTLILYLALCVCISYLTVPYFVLLPIPECDMLKNMIKT
jgi:hypothetical protein